MFAIEEGSTISNAPKNEKAKNKKMPKNRILGTQCVERKLPASGPSKEDTMVPRIRYIAIIDIPKNSPLIILYKLYREGSRV